MTTTTQDGPAAAGDVAEVTWTGVDAPLGRLVVAATDRGLAAIALTDRDAGDVLDRLAAAADGRVAESAPDDRLDPAVRQLDEYFAGDRRGFDLPLDWRLATPFRRAVLETLVDAVPYGETTSYGELAAAAGRPGAARAVGGAVGANPLPVVVPCHRVVRSDGSLGGYGGGPDRKRLLLRLEGVLPA